MAYTELDFTKNNNIQTGLIAQFPTGQYNPSQPGTYNNSSLTFDTPFDINSDGNGNNFYQYDTSTPDQDIFGTLDLHNISDVYELVAAYHPSGGTLGSIEFVGTDATGSALTQTISLVEGQDVRDFYDGSYQNSINGTTTQNAFEINNVQGAGGTGNTGTGSTGTYHIDEIDFHFSTPFATLTNILFEPSSGDNLLVLGATAETACYRGGTLIRTAKGEVSIEELTINDAVVTASGAHRAVQWIGHRRLDTTKHPAPQAVWPVRVLAGAFGEELPTRDLWMSPGHNVFVEGVLVPIRVLINGATVVQVPVDTVTYWHVELDSHDVILAEGLPAESYLDTGNRSSFENGGAFLEAHPDFEPKGEAETCAPIVKSGPPVEAAKAALLARVEQFGHPTTTKPDVHVIADGVRIDACLVRGKSIAFVLPADFKTAALVSRTFVPAHMKPDSTDSRVLGVAVTRLQLDGGDVDLATLAEGWHALERGAGFVRRWTTGTTPLPVGTRLVLVDHVGEGRYWIERKENVVALRGLRGASS